MDTVQVVNDFINLATTHDSSSCAEWHPAKVGAGIIMTNSDSAWTSDSISILNLSFGSFQSLPSFSAVKNLYYHLIIILTIVCLNRSVALRL